VTFLKTFFEMIASAGATGVLIEWEDMFPYRAIAADAASKDAFTEEEVHFILDAASKVGLRTIPLVQTFGHLEHALKTEANIGLREEAEHPGEICPSKNESILLIHAMLDQVLDLHYGASFFGERLVHVGCDEVFHLATCGECRARLARARNRIGEHFGPRMIFMEHAKAITQ